MRGLSLLPVGACRIPGRFVSPVPRRHKSISANRLGVDFPALDAKWRVQSQWAKKNEGNSSPGKAYILPMFPYPSGTLHLGHLRVYTISDVLARFKRLQGYDVIHPIGWDAFGLPAENAAIERGVHPEKWTLQNIAAMKTQMETMGGHWDWDREFRTCDPDFYKHTQRLFLMLHERGLAYQAESLVNFDPVDKTVLANEQVDANGCSWRSGAKVEKVMLKQWFLKISEFRESLLDDLDLLAKDRKWPERVLAMQRNWLGRSRGTKLTFHLSPSSKLHQGKTVDVFTTRADTIFGVQYVALSLDHPIVQDSAKQDKDLREFLVRVENLPPDSKEGYLLSDVTIQVPLPSFAKLEGAEVTEIELPVYAAPYVLSSYGSGAVMGVPGHDSRDHAFWRANAGDSPIKSVINASPGQPSTKLVPGDGKDTPFVDKGFVAEGVPIFSGMTSDEAIDAVVDSLPHLAQKAENWRLRDWLISRQRYWGTPIPIVHCRSCGAVPVPAEDLPVRLPNLPDKFFQGQAGNPLAENPEWKDTTCPKCGSAAERETDTMDTFMDSSWYFFRFLDPKNKDLPVSPQDAICMPVDIYVGGVEHAILHLLYARFISKFLATTHLWPTGAQHHGEPFKQLVTQGMVHGKTYSDPETGRFLRPGEVDLDNPSAPVVKATGQIAKTSFEKMSKSKYNGVDPGSTIAKYGADVTRAHMLFQAPVGDVLEWDEVSITGIQRWLTKVIQLSKLGWTPSDMGQKRNLFFQPPVDVNIGLIDFLKYLRERTNLKSAKLPWSYKTEEEEVIATLEPTEQLFCARMIEIVTSVTNSYSETISLNTIVSDLMMLTNLISNHQQGSNYSASLRYMATMNLLRMLAPICPAVAEEGWQLLHKATASVIQNDHHLPLSPSARSSIFAFGFPTPEPELIPLLTPTVQCVFMVDGKKKFEVGIRKPPAHLQDEDGVRLTGFLLDEIKQSEKGKEWLAQGEGKLWKANTTEEQNASYSQLPMGFGVVVAKGGGVVNVVKAKKRKTGARVPKPVVEV